jgi:hypothetical protein
MKYANNQSQNGISRIESNFDKIIVLEIKYTVINTQVSHRELTILLTDCDVCITLAERFPEDSLSKNFVSFLRKKI